MKLPHPFQLVNCLQRGKRMWHKVHQRTTAMMKLKVPFRDPESQIPSNWLQQRIVCDHATQRSCWLILFCYKFAEWRVNAQNIAEGAAQLNLVGLIQIFLRQHSQLQANTAPPMSADYLDFTEAHPLTMYNSAVATFYVPSDLSGTGGMRKERIRAVSHWRGGHPQFDTALLKTNTRHSTSNDDLEPTINSFAIA